MAANFCSKSFQQNKEENEKVLGQQQETDITGDGDITSDTKKPSNPNEIIFETDAFRLIVKTAPVRRARKFQLEDRQFTLLILPKTQQKNPPLVEILKFLEEGFNAILTEIKTFFKPTEHRIAYLTLYQEPMVYRD